MAITMNMISTSMRQMTIMMTMAEPMSYLTMTKKIVATITTNTTIVFLYTTAAHQKMATMLLMLSTIILRIVLLTAMAHPTMKD